MSPVSLREHASPLGVANFRYFFLGEAVNTATTYGYDSVTMMQETKTTICNVERA